MHPYLKRLSCLFFAMLLALPGRAVSQTTRPASDGSGPVTHGLRLTARLNHESILPGRAVIVTLTLENIEAKEADIPTSAVFNTFKIEVKLPNGEPAPLTLYGKRMTENAGQASFSVARLKIGEKRETRIVLNQLYDMSLDGKYTINISRYIGPDVTVPAGEVTVTSADTTSTTAPAPSD